MKINPTQGHRKGLHVVALFEAFKGFLVLAAGFGILEFIHHDLQKLGEHLIVHFGLDPHHKTAQFLLQLLAGVNDTKIILISCFAVFYAFIHFLEAYGLWKQKNWARWMAIISGGIYLPLEFYALFHKFHWLKALVTLVNICVVIYLIRLSKEKEETLSSST